MSMAQRSPVIRAIRAVLPKKLAHRVIRALIIRMQSKMFKEAREKPDLVAQRILDGAKTALGSKFEPVHFTPSYKPWDQRLCFVPDNDLFNAIVDGKASVVTDRIARIDATGIVLESGGRLDADAIVTATGLQLAVAGKIDVRVNGEPVAWNDRIFYKGCMLSGMPNFAMVIVYANASATLRSEIVARYICRVLRHLDQTGTTVATPTPPPGIAATDEPLLGLQSGYLLRSMHLMPRNGTARPWRLDHDYLLDRAELPVMPIEDGSLVFSDAEQAAGEPQLEAAE
jgi:cation diffusion facilitator CzcD-associated flavoprotein CzcO